VRSLDEPALVILDEPGAGTDPAEGAALAIGLMNYLATRRCLVAIATHSTAVKLHAYSRAGFEAAAVDFDPERLVPLYRLKPHTIGQSYGLAVASRLGLPAEIVAAAREALGTGSIELEQAIERLESERTRLARETQRLQESRATAERESGEARGQADRARHRAEAEHTRMRAEVSGVIEELRREGSEVLRDLKTRAKGRGDLAAFVTRAGEKRDQAAPPTLQEQQPERESSTSLKPGDQVEIGGIRGELLSIAPGRALVARGGLKIEVAPERLRRARGQAPEASTRQPAVTYSTEGSGEAQLNLIGMRTAEALRKLESFLDQAFLTNQREVRIVHGIGSGALRKAVQEYLSTSSYCASFRPADPHHGGSGATIVEMNL
jgi:DNA mismatch repair protein MutS2